MTPFFSFVVFLFDFELFGIMNSYSKFVCLRMELL